MAKPSDFANANIDSIISQLTTKEAVGLIGGSGRWWTYSIPRLSVPSIKVSDGPNGIRGGHFFMATPAKAIPCETALAATWDVDQVGYAAQHLLAEEAKLRGASVILAPTVNIQRSPLGGRSFESFSEDPFLSGEMASSYILNVQARGIGCCIKHFVANDMEDDRYAYSSVVSERALREIYLMPFMIAQRKSKPWCYMTAYNRVNGLHMSENHFYLQDLLRGEWGADTLVMSDWRGTYGLSKSINAGLDLEMPGDLKWRTLDRVKSAMRSKKVADRTLKQRSRKVLELVQKCAKNAPDVVDGDGIERTRDSMEDVKLMRSLAASSIVLLKNDLGLLPLSLDDNSIKSIAVIGPNAKAKLVSGGGSASLKASYFVTPYQGVVNAVRDSKANVNVVYHEGTEAFVRLPTLEDEIFTSSDKRVPGLVASWHSHSDDKGTVVERPVKTQIVDETSMLFGEGYPEGLTERWTIRLKGFLRPRIRDCEMELSLIVDGSAKLFIDGNVVVDNWTNQPKADSTGRSAEIVEVRSTVGFSQGKTYQIFVEFTNVRGESNQDDYVMNPMAPFLRIGGKEIVDQNQSIEESIALAKSADVVILVVGLNGDWETEGVDRTTLKLPHRTDELVEKIIAANRNTVVVTQSGSAIEMPWADSVSSLVHAWYLGNATGDAIADVLFGKVNPSGRLSITFPKRLQDTPSYGHFASQNGEVRYGEDLFVGYKHYQNIGIEPLFPFGYGLSYTTFEFSDLKIVVSGGELGKADNLKILVSLSVSNTGTIVGNETVQVYVSLPSGNPWGHLHPPSHLRSFAKIKTVKPGEKRAVEMTLDKYSVSYWEPHVSKSWRVEEGKYLVGVGVSSANIRLNGEFKISKALEWNGL